MLIIIMHNNKEYLNSIMELAVSKKMKDAKIIEKKGMGSTLIGSDISFMISTRSNSMDSYNKAFITCVEGAVQAENFLKEIESDKYLNLFNLQDRGFICTLPLNSIAEFNKELK
ncbi:MAG: hypothetical protein ABII88_04965 [Candidatus Omnitrophota bacterium]